MTTIESLLAAWDERSSRYLRWKRSMEKGEIEAVIAYRRREAEALPSPGREKALVILSKWVPPLRVGH